VGSGTPAWTQPAGGFANSSPAISGGYIYVGGGGMGPGLYCFDAVTGAFQWRYLTAYAVNSSPASAGGYVYFGCEDGYVYCLEAGDGDTGEWPMFRHDPAHTGEQSIAPPRAFPLFGGWNLIGSGREGAVPLASCMLTDGVDIYLYDEAVAAGWVQTMLYYFTTGYRECRTDGMGDDDHLRPWYGYWLLTYRPGLSIIIPAP